ncbi:MAG: PP2C family protein-serine/threonine phosphatase [Acidobacteriota bacterium]
MKPRPGRIMVVDDDPAMLRAVERILASSYQVEGFLTGERALEAFRSEPRDVAIVDVRMPGMDGFELTHSIKTESPRTEVILVTGSVTDLDEKLVRSVKERAGFFITKPFSRAVLTSLVERCLEMQRLEEERDLLIRRLTEDLTRARRYQQALIPKGLPRSFGPIRVASAYLACESVGGDLFDVVPLSDDRLLLMVADVVGHGVAAALVTGMIKTAIGRSFQDEQGLAPAAGAIIETLAPLGQHRVVTVVLAMIDHRNRTLSYLNAGHPPALVWGEGREPRQLGATTPLLSYGLKMSPEPTVTVPFVPGERLALCTDGLYETLDPSENEFGRDRLFRALSAHPGPIEQVVDSVQQAARRHAAGRPPDDDMTLVVAEFQKG